MNRGQHGTTVPRLPAQKTALRAGLCAKGRRPQLCKARGMEEATLTLPRYVGVYAQVAKLLLIHGRKTRK